MIYRMGLYAQPLGFLLKNTNEMPVKRCLWN
jgi:hypothetical protein